MSGLRAFGSGILFGLGTYAAVAGAASIPYFTGPTGSNPTNLPPDLSTLNTLIVNTNASISAVTSSGVTCPTGTTTSSFATVNGIVTHC